MKKIKILTIIAAAAVVSAGLYSTPTFASDLLDLNLSNVETNTSANSVKGTFEITNNGDETINLSDLKLRYYYTADSSTEQEFHCYHASIADPYKDLTSNISGRFVKMDKAMEGADTYLEIKFDSNAGTLAPGEKVKVQPSINKTDWSNYNQSNDYSFNDSSKIVVLVNGNVVSGTAPSKEVTDPTDPTSPSNPGEVASKVEISVSNGSENNAVKPVFKVTNTSSAPLDLTTLKLKYYYTSDGEEAQNFNCYYAGTTNGTYKALTQNVVGEIKKLSPAGNNADSYIQVTFNGGTLEAGQTMEVQASVNKENWQNYDQSNDYSYNSSNKVTAYADNKLICGTEPGKEVEVLDSKLNKNSISVDKANLSDEVISMILNGNTFKGITDLQEGVDYTVNGDGVTLSKDYLKALAVGSKTITFNFSAGNSQKLTINVADSSVTPPIEKDSIITPTSISYNKADKSDINVTMTLNGNALTNLQNNGVALVPGTDYVVANNIVTLKESYLNTLEEGKVANITFNFSAGKPQTLSIDVSNKVVQGLVIGTSALTAKAGETITIPVSINGITADGLNGCNFKLQYDTNLFENPTVTAGGICVNPTKTFFKTITTGTGVLSVMYADSTGKDLEAISQDGVFMNITLKVKDEAANTTSGLAVAKAGTFIDKNLVKYTVNYKLGKITIGDDVVDPPVYTDSTLNKTSVDFDKTNTTDAQVEMVLNGNTLTEIKNSDVALVNGTDYTVNESKVVLSKDYLSTLPLGTSNLTFKFSAGANANLNVNVIDSGIITPPEVKDSTLNTTSVDFDKANTTDAQVEMVLNGNTLTEIKNSDVALVNGVDYTVNGSSVVLSKDYLSRLQLGSSNLTFKFSAGADANLSVNVIKSQTEGLIAGIGTIEAKAGDIITIPITLSGIPESGLANFSYKLAYDSNVLEAVEINPGDIITNPDNNFMSGIFPDRNFLSVLFIDTALDDTETIKKGGVMTNIKFKVKDNASVGKSTITFKMGDDSFYYLDGTEAKIQYSNGSVEVK